VENKDCHIACGKHRFRPEQQDPNLSNNCLNRPPTFRSGETYDLNLENTDKYWDFTFALGYITGKFDAAASTTSTCVFSLRSDAANWAYKGGTWVKVGEAILILFAVVVVAYALVAAIDALVTAAGVSAVASTIGGGSTAAATQTANLQFVFFLAAAA